VTAAAAPRRRPANHVIRVAPLVVGLAFWLVLPIACLVSLGVGIDHVARHIHHVPTGTKGSFLVTSHSCERQLCITAGTFTSTDGRIVEPNLLGDYRWELGKKYGVVYNSNAAEIISLPASWDPSSTVVGLAGGVAFLGLWGWCLFRALIRRRTVPGQSSAPTGATP
jgi:hypothetical protein